MKSLISFLKFILVLFVHTKAIAFWDKIERPMWTYNLPKEDINYIYYIGRSSEIENETEGFSQAINNAREQAITQNFGVYTQFRTETYQSNEKALLSQNFNSISQNVILEEFEQREFYQENNNYWVLFRYDKKSIEKEKERLIKLNNKNAIPFLVSGSEEASLINGTLEIISSPLGAPVRIDGKDKIGDLKLKTPLRLMGIYKTGKHKIEIDDSKFKTFTAEIELHPGITTTINERLEIAYGKINIRTNTENAEVFVNNKSIGKTPIDSDVVVEADSQVSIELKHPEKFSKKIYTQVGKDLIKYESIDLVTMPGFITINTMPADTHIEINDSLVSTHSPLDKFELPSGKVKIRISKVGFESKEITLGLKGNEEIVLPKINLRQYQPSYLVNALSDKDKTVSINGEKLISDSFLIYPGEYKIEIQKNGFKTLSESLTVGENQNIDINQFELILQPKKTINNLVIGLGFAIPHNLLSKNADIDSLMGASLSINLNNRIGFQFSYYSNDKSIEESRRTLNGPNNVENSILSIGAPIALSKSFLGELYIVPEYVKLKNEYIQKWNDMNGKEQETKFPNQTVKDNYFSGSIEYRFFNERDNDDRYSYGLKIKHGLIQNNSYRGETCLEVTIGF